MKNRYLFCMLLAPNLLSAQVVTTNFSDVQTDAPINLTNSTSYEWSGSTATVGGGFDAFYVLKTQGEGGNPASGAQALTFVNEAPFTLTLQQTFTSFSKVATFQMSGGTGSNSSANNAPGGTGGAAAALNLTNSEPISVNLGGPNGFNSGGAVLEVVTQGGSGGNVPNGGFDGFGNPEYKSGGTGGGGGATGEIFLTNNEAITFGSQASPIGVGGGDFHGIRVASNGGNAGLGGFGASGGAVSGVQIYNYAPMTLNVNNQAGLGNLFGISAEFTGGDGTASFAGNVAGGAGGAITNGNYLDVSGNITISTSNPTQTTQGAAVFSSQIGGNGGAGFTSSAGGVGGNAGVPTAATVPIGNVTWATTIVLGGSVETTGNGIRGLVAEHVGGTGGSGGTNSQDSSNGGTGGSAGDLRFSINGNANLAAVTTSGDGAVAISGKVQGGTGGAGTDYNAPAGAFDDGAGGDGGAGGDAGQVFVNVFGATNLATSGENAHGVEVVAAGGAGGTGGSYNGGFGGPGSGGAGGDAGALTLQFANKSSLETTGDGAFGVLGITMGGTGGAVDPGSSSFGSGGTPGGAGGNAGDISFTLTAPYSISTQGEGANAVVLQSIGGVGGAGTTVSNVLVGEAGNGGVGGESGVITVTNSGTVTTAGDYARGLLVQGLSGAGGDSGDSSGLFYAGNPGGSSSGAVGASLITNSGAIATLGENSHAIHVQGIAGPGGAADSPSFGLVTVGGNNSTNPVVADGGDITITNTGSVSTAGYSAFGILAQSVGGGGGDGGNPNLTSSSTSLLFNLGSSGGAGGAGGTSTISLNGGKVATSGTLGHGVIAQSVGGGGGTGGTVSSFNPNLAIAVGGAGGNGGDGGEVNINAQNATVTTTGSNAVALFAQSTGGGGGSGGGGFAYSAGSTLGVDVGVGGTGGGGGDGGEAMMTVSASTISTGQIPAPISGNYVPVKPSSNLNEGPFYPLPTDAYGAVVQSVGGGGGHGGTSLAESLSLAIPTPTVSIAADVDVSVGGEGGDGGAGGSASLLLENGAILTTAGQGSHAVVVQSISGGGGLGGDSSAVGSTIFYKRVDEAEETKAYSADITVTVGGSGGASLNGGSASLMIGGLDPASLEPTGTPVEITSFGDYATGALVQSIGGGGGNGGTGSSTTSASGNNRGLNLSVNVGGAGAGGGDGGTATAQLNPGSTILTLGASAPGMLIQSIGGGGGASMGGNLNLGESGSSPDVNPDVNIGMGLQSGAEGGAGGAVFGYIYGAIDTFGGDSVGVIAQSIAGGGGVGGSAGSDASADNPVIDRVKGTREFVNDGIYKERGTQFNLNINMGGTGGSALPAGEVEVYVHDSITTRGDHSHGVLAQSIGGGGGKAGTATSTGVSEITQRTINLVAAIGGKGGTGGDGGNVLVSLLGGSIQTGSTGLLFDTALPITRGYSAYGLLAQSIGGGGGAGADGSDSSEGEIGISLGGTFNRSGGAGGNGGEVTADLSQQSSILTVGDVAHAAVLQSIGGGGGTGVAGSSVYGALGQESGSATIAVGGGTNASGNGGAVNFTASDSTLSTAGISAFGLVAQSIGGGGGIGGMLNNEESGSAIQLGGATSKSSSGGEVTLSLQSADISTSGASAHAIIAQSIGGGGGIAGYSGAVSTIGTLAPTTNASNGSGAAVNINIDGTVATTGDSAFGLLAQSIGAGGGLLAQGSTLFLGTTGTGNSSGTGGAITITQAGSVNVSGVNSTAIFAQSTSYQGGSSPYNPTSGSGGINITLNGAVSGGSGSGVGVWVDGGTTGNTLTIGPGGSLTALSGNAVKYTGFGRLNVVNNGTVIGSAALTGENGTGTFTNKGTFQPAASSTAAKTPQLAGKRVPEFNRATIDGHFIQTKTGSLLLRSDFQSGRGDRLHITGDAQLNGTLRTTRQAILPFTSIPFLQVEGDVTGDLEFDTGSSSNLFTLGLVKKGRTLKMEVTEARFASPGFDLSENQREFADHLSEIWKSEAGPTYERLFVLLDNTTENPSQYGEILDQLTLGNTLAFAARRALETHAFARSSVAPRLNSEGELAEGSWAITSGDYTRQSSESTLSGFDLTTSLTQVGGQGELFADWFLGGSVAYAYESLGGNEASGGGHSALAAVTLQHQRDAWRFSAAAYGSLGFYETTRNLSLPLAQRTASASPDIQTLGLLIRGSYRKEFGASYVEPSLNLNTISVHASSYSESGADNLGLQVDSRWQTSLIVNPAIEGGMHTTLAGGDLRAFAKAGMVFITTDAWKQNARLAAAPSGSGFTAELPIDPLSAEVTLGVEFKPSERVAFLLQYEGEFSENIVSNGGSFGIRLGF